MDKLLNVGAWVALALIAGGVLAFIWSRMAGDLMEAAGWFGVWIVGTLSERRARSSILLSGE